MNSPEIIECEDKLIVGMFLMMSLSEDKTGKLWKNFMPRRNEIKHQLVNGYFSVQEYENLEQFHQFTVQTEFKKWAAIEVYSHEEIPKGMVAHTLAGGTYAKFIHVGIAAKFPKTLNYIFGEWLPNSNYVLDHRPHFEIMGEKYLGIDNEASEEEVYIPIRKK